MMTTLLVTISTIHAIELVELSTKIDGDGVHQIYLYTEEEHNAVMNALNRIEELEAKVEDISFDLNRLKIENNVLWDDNKKLADNLIRALAQRNGFFIGLVATLLAAIVGWWL